MALKKCRLSILVFNVKKLLLDGFRNSSPTPGKCHSPWTISKLGHCIIDYNHVMILMLQKCLASKSKDMNSHKYQFMAIMNIY